MNRSRSNQGRRAGDRRGAVMIVVLSLLVLFTLIGVTFVIIASRYRRAAEAVGRSELKGTDPRDLLDSAMYPLVRDTNNQHSALHTLGLLTDLYGNSLRGSVRNQPIDTNNNTNSVRGVFNNQFLEIDFDATDVNFSPIAGALNGCVFTLTSGPLRGNSTRVVGYSPEPLNPPANGTTQVTRGTLRIETILDDAYRTYSANDIRGESFVINGVPFNGTGTGYSIATGNLDATASVIGPNGNTVQVPYVFLPRLSPDTAPANAMVGNADESYDAVDTQNMFMSLILNRPPGSGSGGNLITDIVPSFHRPSLVRFWIGDPGGSTQYFQTAMGQAFPTNLGDSRNPSALQAAARRVLRRITFRPLPYDHPNFTGGNPLMARGFTATDAQDAQIMNQLRSTTAGIWDVDNDGDGIADSIWLDLGMPAITDKDGRRYKPLFAILCRDLDGRLSLNAHDSLAHVMGIDVDADTTADYQWNTSVPGTHAVNAASQTTVYSQQPNLPRGMGVGPAEIALENSASPIFIGNELTQLLTGRKNGSNVVLVPGRYASDQLPGISSTDDQLSAVKQTGIPKQFFENIAQPLAYAQSPDVLGFDSVSLDFNGQPISLSSYVSDQTGEQYPDQRLDDPYEKNLGGVAGRQNDSHDKLFSPSELERLLRWHDLDASQIPSRLIDLAPQTFSDARKRSLVTTEGRHLPVANAGAFAEVRQRLRDIAANATSASQDERNYWSLFYQRGVDNTFLTSDDQYVPSVTSLYAARLLDGGVAFNQLNTELAKIVPTELLKGELFDINRPWGNGQDDNGNDVIDDPAEAALTAATREQAFVESEHPATLKNSDLDHLYGSGAGIVDPQYARQVYARHLYCTMMMLIEEGFQFPFAPVETINPGQRRDLTAARIAQWSINVVDFRDPDAIMTPFEYDVNPFNGWQATIDGNPATLDPPPAQGQSTPPNERRIVWGAEYPDLLLTETSAMHDRRVKDTKDDDGASGGDEPHSKREKENSSPPEEGDEDLDQYRIPQGSLFLELYCPRNAAVNNPRLPRELYSVSYNSMTGDYTAALDLGRVAPQSADGRRYPVWRVALSERHHDNLQVSPLTRTTSRPDSTSFEPANMSYPGLVNPNTGVAEPLNIERVVWLSPLDPGTPNAGNANERANNTYYVRNIAGLAQANLNQPQQSSVLLAPGNYAVVGPRELTRIGTDDDMNTATHFDPSPHVLSLANRTFTALDNDGTNRYPPTSGMGQQIQPPLGLVVAAKPPTSWTNHQAIWDNSVTGGIGVSISEPLPNGPQPYYPEPGGMAAPPYIYDTVVGRPDGYDDPDPAMRNNMIPDEPFDDDPNMPLGDDPNLLKTGTTNNFASAFLQRLANPLAAHDPTTNPYITVDWATIDLTVFNGEDKEPSGYPSQIGPYDPSDPDPDGNDEVRFSSRERGNRRLASNTNPYNPTLDPNPGTWDYDVWQPVTSGPVRGNVAGANTLIFRHNFMHSLGYLNRTMGQLLALQGGATPDEPEYVGSPAKPFPWVTWNNRPFASPYELMLVPSSSQARLLHERKLADPSENDAYYRNDETNYIKYFAPFGDSGYLLNFFRRTDLDPNQKQAQLFRLFDLVETPSPFVGAEKWYRPSTAVGSERFQTPFNKFSRFRDPGRININTVFDQDVWNGITRNFPNMTTQWNDLVTSRRGYAGAGLLATNASFPTFFANPIRSAASADLMPDITDMRADGTGALASIEATLLRQETPGSDNRLIRHQSTQLYNDSTRNPYFRYQSVNRLPNLLSSHSNVYAVWITVGYFEVSEWTSPTTGAQLFDEGHPDGFQLGQEVGSLSGEIERHRAFYLIDRSIPVAFEPGENHNVDRAILIRRFIE